MKHVKIILSLLVVVLVCMVAVFQVEGITTPVIEKRLSDAANAALLEIFPDTEVNNVTSDYPVDDVVKEVYIMTKDGENVGVIYKAEVAGFNPGIQFLLGVNLLDDTIAGYSTLVNGETAGVGKDLLEHPLFAEQFSGVSMDSLKSNGVDVVAGVSAPITLGGVNTGIKAVLTYHGVNFKGEVVETEEMKIERIKSEFFSNATYTDITSKYPVGDNITQVLEASNGGLLITATFRGYVDSHTDPSVYMIGIDTNDTITGFEVLSTTETAGIGADLVSHSKFAAQFKGMSIESFKANGAVDSVGGATAPMSLAGVNSSITDVITYYSVNFKGEKVETEEERFERLQTELFSGATFEEVFSNYPDNDIIIEIYEASTGGTIYYVTAQGYHLGLDFLLGIDEDLNVVGIRLVEHSESPGFGADLLESDEFVQAFENVELDMFAEGTAIDIQIGASGSPMTNNGLNKAMKELVEYHKYTYLGLEKEPPKADTPVPEASVAVINEMAPTSNTYINKLIEGDKIQGVYVSKDSSGNVVGTFYDLVSDNGGFGLDNKIMVQFDPSNNTIVKVVVYEGNSTYTDEHATGKGNEIGHPDISVVWEGVSQIGQVTESDLDSASGTTANHTFEKFIKSVEEAISYQIENNVGGAE